MVIAEFSSLCGFSFRSVTRRTLLITKSWSHLNFLPDKGKDTVIWDR